MSEVEESNLKLGNEPVVEIEVDEEENELPLTTSTNEPITVLYCPKCTWPPEFCEYGQFYESHCLPWIMNNCPEILGEQFLADKLAKANLNGDGGDGGEEVSYILSYIVNT